MTSSSKTEKIEINAAAKAVIQAPAEQADKLLAGAEMAALRREDVTRPVIYIGMGTCGLGAGAGHTLAAIRE